ncbi:hypothetical protein E3E12_00130 [Formicincola oecophyllae]|uniref:Uncharacterized protein n=1 Tax=Formicincola oecophyllae TaxID=2558361 RepID=A0A4Y6U8V2_9PROT|nr:hypothetical protein [Formicincola oecophyllae]QDH12876.1 hypothetical protein E3E12_00130 [Formicincola oecophyllae]
MPDHSTKPPFETKPFNTSLDAQVAAGAGLYEEISREITQPVPPALKAFAQGIVEVFPKPPVGVLFYGSLARPQAPGPSAGAAADPALDPSGVLDFYVVVESTDGLLGSALERKAARVLPPNVYYWEEPHSAFEARTFGNPAAQPLRAKVAVITVDDFRARCRPSSLDTTLWARFSQPCRLVWAPSETAAASVASLLCEAVLTAAWWAFILPTPSQAQQWFSAQDWAAFWRNLYAHTYKAELRVEGADRSASLLAGQVGRYGHMLLLAWMALGLLHEGKLSTPAPEQRQAALEQWGHIMRAGKVLNGSRLLKALFTFRGGVDYILWKIHRHTGQVIPASDFERNHPLLGLPRLLWRLRHIPFMHKNTGAQGHGGQKTPPGAN